MLRRCHNMNEYQSFSSLTIRMKIWTWAALQIKCLIWIWSVLMLAHTINVKDARKLRWRQTIILSFWKSTKSFIIQCSSQLEPFSDIIKTWFLFLLSIIIVILNLHILQIPYEYYPGIHGKFYFVINCRNKLNSESFDWVAVSFKAFSDLQKQFSWVLTPS